MLPPRPSAAIERAAACAVKKAARALVDITPSYALSESSSTRPSMLIPAALTRMSTGPSADTTVATAGAIADGSVRSTGTAACVRACVRARARACVCARACVLEHTERASAHLTDVSDERLEPVSPACEHADGGARARERRRKVAAESGRRARHDCDAVLEREEAGEAVRHLFCAKNSSPRIRVLCI